MNKRIKQAIVDVPNNPRISRALENMMYHVEIFRDGEWHLVGQYTARYNAQQIADDYISRGERARVTYE